MSFFVITKSNGKSRKLALKLAESWAIFGVITFFITDNFCHLNVHSFHDLPKSKLKRQNNFLLFRPDRFRFSDHRRKFLVLNRPSKFKSRNETEKITVQMLLRKKVGNVYGSGGGILMLKWRSVTSKKLPNVHKSCPKRFWHFYKKMPKNVGNLGKLIVVTGFEKLPKVQ